MVAAGCISSGLVAVHAFGAGAPTGEAAQRGRVASLIGGQMVDGQFAMSDAAAPEVLFYHLESQPLERVLPMLLEKTLAKGWRAVVQVGSEERLEALDAALWTYADDSFLPHGSDRGANAARHPVFLTTADDAPNGGRVRFLVDGAVAAAYTGASRFVYLFDGGDREAVASARDQWRAAKAAGCTVTYWRQTADGRWEKMA